ncbi:Mitogen-activated protein kinase-binding protein [Penicillium digitatum]|uniref:Mitogen-activated protein kinase-binding protein n=1 Tax=Penicillium digitatum TaxID=36651 RepID=A0A7T7BMN3_PENDI|nr:Mitogen-activated protein kinase-binding protein [Penicillium digitatum]
MATTAPLSAKSKLTGPGGSLKITPSNSPILRPGIRSPSKTSHQSFLSLQTVIGTTATTPNGFSSHDQSRSFALCAGSAAVLAELDENDNMTQRFFRARPSATSVNPSTSFYNHSTPPATPDPRSRSVSHIRSSPHLNLLNGSPSSEVIDTSPRGWSSRERIKAVTSVSISPNGRFLAVGETGYNPRVLIFSTARDALPDVPLSILNEHTFGVRSLAFSADSQYLATLGNPNDGFLFIWTINLKNGSAKLHSVNKCTAVIKDMCWVGQSLVTTGLRHVKVWRLPTVIRPVSPAKARLNLEGTGPSPNPIPKALSGRNCLLGALGDNIFTCVNSISYNEAVIGTDSGAVCFFDDREGSQKMITVKQVGFSITSLAVDYDSESIWLGGRGRQMQRVPFEVLRSSGLSPPVSSARLDKNAFDKKSKTPAITCMGSLNSHLVTVESTCAIHLYPIKTLSDDGEQERGEASMPAHCDPILGICRMDFPNDLSSDFFTWSRDGSVNFWDVQGKCRGSKKIDLDQFSGKEEDSANELKVLRTAENAGWFVSADKFGVLRIFSNSDWTCLNEARAHGGEITDVAIQGMDDTWLIASSGRDRMVQLFERRDTELKLIQTMDDHVGAVGQLMFINEGEKLLSCSADRTVVIRDRATREVDGGTSVAYLISRVITQKSSPVSMTLCPDDSNILYLSTMDRCVSKFDISSGHQLHCFKATDSETADAVVLSSLTVASEILGQTPKVLIGVSSTDKSIRVYDLERDQLLTGEFGHTEGVSDMLLLEERDLSDGSQTKRTVVSAGMDGILMIWDLSVSVQQQVSPDLVGNVREEDETPVKEMAAARPPLRKVLSRSELAGFQRPDSPNPTTPTPIREQSPTLPRKLSRLSLAPSSLKNHAVSEKSSPPNRLSPTSGSGIPQGRRRRSPSPVSPKSRTSTARKPHSVRTTNRRTSIEFRNRSKTTPCGDFGSLEMSTEQLCRSLRAYRKKLNGSNQRMQAQKELERELSLTLRIVGGREQSSDESGETETDSSGKDTERERKQSYAVMPKSPHVPRRMPSTPSLRLKGVRQVSRSRSCDPN